MKLDNFSMYDAVQGIPDVRHIVAIMFGRTELEFIKAVLEKSGYPFGSETSWTKQLREIHGEWLTKGKTLEGIRGYMGMVDPFNRLESKKSTKPMVKFQFLYYLGSDSNGGYDPDKFRTKVITAKNIQSACKIFLQRKPESLYKIDYEVKVGGDDFVDISEIEGVKNFI